jgi:hypothetical protein
MVFLRSPSVRGHPEDDRQEEEAIAEHCRDVAAPHVEDSRKQAL